MKLSLITRDDNYVIHAHTDDTGILAREDRKIKSHEATLAHFEEPRDALAPIAANILAVGKEYTQNMGVRTLRIKYSKHGTRTAQIEFVKTLAATDGVHRMKTPFFQIDDCHGEKEQGHLECSKKQAETIKAFIVEAEKYVGGARQQRLLPLVEAEPTDGEQLPGTENT